MTHSIFAIGVIALAGCLAAVQAPMNAASGPVIGSSTAAATISFGVGFVVLLAYTVWNGEHSSITRAVSGNLWLLFGGVLGAFYVWAIL